MGSRRDFLSRIAAGLAALPSLPAAVAGAAGKSSLSGPIGLQLWSVRESLKKDVPGTLARVRAMGFEEVETAGTWGQTVEQHRAALDKAGLRCRACHMPYDKLSTDAAAVLRDVKTLGASWVVCAWIPHGEKAFTRGDALTAGKTFNQVGKAARDQGLRFAYHCHGYEFIPSSEGTLFDTLLRATDKALVSIEVDVFWAKAGGADPAKLIKGLKGRVPFLHVKDLKKGVTFPEGTSAAPDETNVVVGTGQIDWPTVLRAAGKSGVEAYFIEDESPDPFGQIPQSLRYLEGLRL
jgi:sugar phosphate isomerase/epimerase